MIAALVVAVAGVYLVGLAGVSFIRPDRARRFLAGHASSARTHYVEMSVRLVVGAALVRAAPAMMLADAFMIFGWILIASTLVLVAMPWRVHQRFAAWSVPLGTRNLELVAVGALVGGVVVLSALALGPR